MPLKWSSAASSQVYQDIPSSFLYAWSGNHLAYGVVTLAGSYKTSVSLAIAQTLYATFYSDDAIPTPIESRMVSTYKTHAIMTDQLPSLWNFIRWQGLLRPKSSDVEVQVFTFKLESTGILPKLRFWFDNQIVIDSTEREDLTVLEEQVESREATSYFDFAIEYFYRSSLTDDWEISWKQCSQSFCDESFVDIDNSVFGDWMVSSHDSVEFYPGILCASTSFVQLPEMQYASAGQKFSFALITRDEFGNRKSEGGDQWLGWLLPADVWDSMKPIKNSTSYSCPGCQINYGVVKDDGDGTYSFNVVTNKTGVYKLMVQNLVQVDPFF